MLPCAHRTLPLVPLLVVFAACAAPVTSPEQLAEVAAPLSYDCNKSQATGYDKGKAFTIELVHVLGKPVEVHTADALLTMMAAAEKDGVKIGINDGFRSMDEQKYFYNCYKTCSCNSCSPAASPGYSNHQSGHAIDFAMGNGGKAWIFAHAAEYGFDHAVGAASGEDWHWEWWGGGSPQAYCSIPPLAAEYVGQGSDAPPDPTGAAYFKLCQGQTFHFQFEVRNVGGTSWVDWGEMGTEWGRRVRLGIPGDGPSPLGAPGRISLNENANPDVHSALEPAPDCNDKALCRRTTFSKNGIEGKAPLKNGVFTAEYQLVDEGRAWFGPKMSLTYRVEECASPAGGAGAAGGQGQGGKAAGGAAGATAGGGNAGGAGEASAGGAGSAAAGNAGSPSTDGGSAGISSAAAGQVGGAAGRGGGIAGRDQATGGKSGSAGAGGRPRGSSDAADPDEGGEDTGACHAAASRPTGNGVALLGLGLLAAARLRRTSRRR